MFSLTDPFIKLLQSQGACSVYLKPYWGNSGDVLIWMGNELLLKEIGLEQVKDPREADIVLWPGGNPTMWEAHLEAWRDCWRRWSASKFIVAPATFQGDIWPKLLGNAPANVIGVFARDLSSYLNLQKGKLPAGIEIGLGHDPAFHLKESEWISQHRKAATSEYVLVSFRDDRESALGLSSGSKLPPIWPFSSVSARIYNRRKRKFYEDRMKNVKAIIGPNKTIVELDAPMMSFEAFVECVRRASQVHTDRLHCMILAVLLGKEVFAYRTTYGKLEAVYEHSIKSWAEVKFVGA